MATDINNTNEDADMTECEGEKVVTMMDVLKEQEDFEEDANAVLGGSDDKNCTYSKGYIKRQAIYACLTCCADAKTDPDKRAGVCLACSLMCHENHELIELYTKRNFKCDCGNPKFNSHPCTFTPNKTEINDENHYNQNFSGLYCTCKRPYPDPEATEEDVMIQCIICEDWLHSSHLDSNVPANDQYSEMVCKQCMDRNEFLHDYSELVVNTECTIEIVQVNGNEARSALCNDNAKNIDLVDSTYDSENKNSNIDVETTETKQDVTSAEDEKSTNELDINEESVVKDEPKKVELNTEDSDSLRDSSLNENSDKVKDAIETIENDLNAPPPLETDTNEQASTEETATSSETPEDKDNIEKSDIDNDKNDIKETSQSNEDESEINTQVTASIDDTSVIDSNKSETEQISKDQESKSIENSDEEKHKKEQDAEKMEEDRLLADPGEEPESNSSNLNDKETTNTECITKENENIPETTDKTDTSEKNVEENTQNENNIDKSNEKMEIIESATTDPTTISETKENVEQSPMKQDKPSEKRKLSIEETADNLDTKKIKLDTQNKACCRPKGVKKMYKGATFWPSSFRQKLCTCEECISMYRDLSVLYLTDPDDTVTAYENLGKEIINGKPLTQYEKGLEALSSLDRIQQINALTEYNKMRDKLLDFLKSFKDRKEIVKEEDIKAFFAGMKPKREPDGVYFCREV